MMSEYLGNYHRWEPLAEFHFIIDEEEEMYSDKTNNYTYCLCSRAFIRDNERIYYLTKCDESESDGEVLSDTSTTPIPDPIPTDTANKVRSEKDEASCYCSASHTENCCSTDEHDPVQGHNINIHGLQPSDSGADLTYPDFHSDNHDKPEHMDQDYPGDALNTDATDEDYLHDDTWEKFWALNGERIIWASWISNYSDYINPGYLDGNNDLIMDNNIPKQHSVDGVHDLEQDVNVDDECMRERKFSYDSKVNPYKKHHKEPTEKVDCNETNGAEDDTFVPIARVRSCSENVRMLSPRTIAGTDSMTNVTKFTYSSYDVTSSHVTSESSPTEGCSGTSSPTDDQSNDQTRIANIEEILDTPVEEMNTEEYWQFLWKKHFGEQYALHYANYIETHAKNKTPPIDIEVAPQSPGLQDDTAAIESGNSVGNSHKSPSTIEAESQVEDTKTEDKGIKNSGSKYLDSEVTPQNHIAQGTTADIDCRNCESNFDESPSVTEVQAQVEVMKLEDNTKEIKRRKKSPSRKYLLSVGYLLQNLVQDKDCLNDSKIEEETKNEVVDAGEQSSDKNEPVELAEGENVDNVSHNNEYVSNNKSISDNNDEEDDDPPDEKPVALKRSHELEEEEEEDDEEAAEAQKINTTFQIMGFCINKDKMPKGVLVYKKKNTRLRPPRSKARKTYFDDDGNPLPATDQDQDIQNDQNKSEMQDVNSTEVIDSDKATADTSSEIDSASRDFDVQNKLDHFDETEDIALEASQAPLPDEETLLGDVEDESEQKTETVQVGSTTKCKRRQKRHKIDNDESDLVDNMPPELIDDPKMKKYWKKRHSLFHRFDEGIQLDRESWFSVTPESVAWHIANKVTYDVVLDAFCGAGGNTIQFARVSKKVIAIDIDPAKIEMARHNATVYGVRDKIEFIVGDFFELASGLRADMVFLSPPWGGPQYSENQHYDLETMLLPRPASQLMKAARLINDNITLYLPRNSQTDQILALAKVPHCSVEVEQSYLDRRFVAITAYFYLD